MGPGFKDNFIPSYLIAKSLQVDENAWKDRDLHEINFTGDKFLEIGKFQAHDFYSDRCFYLLSSLGHAIGHILALARTTVDPPTFILLGGDIAYYCGEFRLSQYIPFLEIVSPNPLSHYLSACPGKIFMAIYPKNDLQAPFFDPTRAVGWHHDTEDAQESIYKLIEADAHDNIFPVIAHDMSLQGNIKFYPKKANS